MLVILPPSETKRDGGDAGSALDLGAIGFPQLTPQRRTALAALKKLSRNLRAATGALGLGPTQRFEIDRNRVVETSPVMPAMDRFTGVLFDALDAETLPAEARKWMSRSVVIHSALLGLVRADDPIPAYRLSHNSRLPGLSLRVHWRDAVAGALAAQQGLVLDLRSEAYVALGAAPAGSFYLRVVTDTPGGQKKALNHFNKHAKGDLVRALALSGIDHGSIESLLEWASANGIRLIQTGSGILELTV